MGRGLAIERGYRKGQGMFRRTRTEAAKENAAAAAELAAQLAADRKFRKQLLAAAGHGVSARRRAGRQLGLTAAAMRLATDEELRGELRRMVGDLQAARARLERKRSHKLRNWLLVLAGSGAAAAAAATWPAPRRWMERVLGVASPDGPRAIEATVEVEVPVSTAYNQWTQFEEFPQFMEGVESVTQLDDARLHWVATVAGRRAEWDARILEQHPDRQVSWISEDGRKTRGTVTFESLGENRTLVRLSMSYLAEGVRDAVGATVGVDQRQVQGDLTHFKERIEAQGRESGAWRGEISAAGTP
jgi:uncharacterized membrane protein